MSAITTDKEQVTRATGVVGVATMASRILGAVRDIVFASLFGAGMVSDAFIAAFRIPNLLRRLFGEGSLSIAFVPVFTDCLVHDGEGEARRMAISALRFLALVLALLSFLGVILAPGIVRILAPGFAQWPAAQELTVHLTRIMMPYIFFIGLVALCMGILNVMGHFAAPAFAPVFLNLAMIAVMTVSMFVLSDAPGRSIWLAVGVLIGGSWQLGLQIPILFYFRMPFWKGDGFWHPRLKKVLLLMGPVLFGAAVYQINSVVLTLLATLISQGSVSYLYYADRLIQLPLGIFALAAATAVLPALSRQAAGRQWDALRQTFAHTIRFVFFLTLPAMAGLIVLRRPIVELLFQRGAFDATATALTADVLLYYGIGLWSFAAVRIVLNLFFALKDTHTPAKVAVISVSVNFLCAIVLMRPMEHNGLALSLSLSSIINLLLLVAILRKKMGALGWRQIAHSIARSGVCAAIMGVCVWFMGYWLIPVQGIGGMRLLLGLGCCITVGIIIYCASAYILRISELQDIMTLVAKRTRDK